MNFGKKLHNVLNECNLEENKMNRWVRIRIQTMIGSFRELRMNENGDW